MIFYNNFNNFNKNILLKKYKYVNIFNILNKINKIFESNILWVLFNYKRGNIYSFNIHQFNFFLRGNYNILVNKIKNYSFYYKYYNLHNYWSLQFLLNQNAYILVNTYSGRKSNTLNYKNLFKSVDNTIKSNYFHITSSFSVNYFKEEYSFNLHSNEKKRIFIFMNNLYFDSSNAFIFNELNLSYLYTYLKEYTLTKFLLNTFSINKWLEFYKDNKFSTISYFKDIDILKFNVTPTIFFNKKQDKVLNNYFIIYQIKSIQWLLLHAIRQNMRKIFNNTNIHIRVAKYDLNDIVDTWPIKYEFMGGNLPFQNRSLLDELIDSLLILLFYKDISIFISWVRDNMRLIYFFKQNAFIILIKNLIEYIFHKYNEDSKFLGYKIIFKGKLNKLGNVRKKKMILTEGFTALSNVNYKSDYQSESITTTTGVIGIKVIINYL